MNKISGKAPGMLYQAILHPVPSQTNIRERIGTLAPRRQVKIKEDPVLN